MKIETTKEKIQAVVAKAERLTGKHLSLPILSHLLLAAKRGELTVRATNLDMGLEYSFPVKVEKEGEVAVPAAILSSFFSSLGNAKSVVLQEDEGKLLVTGGGARARIHTTPKDDFPTIPKADGVSFAIDPHLLVKGFKSVQYAGALGNLKPELGSVSVFQDGEELIFAATDSFRLAEKRIPLKKTPAGIPAVLVPVKNAAEFVRLLESERDEVRLAFGKGQLSVEGHNFFITSRLVEGVFPDYRQIMPKDFVTEVIVLREELLSALKLTTLFSDRFNQLRFRIDPKKKLFELLARSEGVGESTQSVSAAISGNALESNFNHRFVSDCLTNIGSDSVALRFSGENKPLLIGGVGDQSFRYLVMPMNR